MCVCRFLVGVCTWISMRLWKSGSRRNMPSRLDTCSLIASCSSHTDKGQRRQRPVGREHKCCREHVTLAEHTLARSLRRVPLPPDLHSLGGAVLVRALVQDGDVVHRALPPDLEDDVVPVVQAMQSYLCLHVACHDGRQLCATRG